MRKMEDANLSAGGRLICPFLRPSFISRRQYESLVKTGESLIAAIDRMEQMVLQDAALLSRLELLPAEKMLAAIDPGYQSFGSFRAAGYAPGERLCTLCNTTPIRPPAPATRTRWPICSTTSRR
jgi:hypothetical protein